MNDDIDNPLEPFKDDELRIVPPDYTLKKLIGEDVDIRQALSEENMEKAQKIIEGYTNNFLEWVAADLTTLDSCYKEALSNPANAQDAINKLARTAFIIKSQAGTFGYSLATSVAKSLDEFCAVHPSPSAEHLLVIRKHIDTLHTIFNQHITGDCGAIGHELTQGLFKLVEKYKG